VVFRALALSFTLLSTSLDLLFGWLDENLKERSRERKEPSYYLPITAKAASTHKMGPREGLLTTPMANSNQGLGWEMGYRAIYCQLHFELAVLFEHTE
jgi:hypothetical protein